MVSVIVPVHLGMLNLSDCLVALSRQDYPTDRYEVIVVDNGGNAGIEALLDKYANAHLVSETVPGSYAARNAGIRHARGDVFAFTDADCRPHIDWLRQGVAPFVDKPDTGLVGGAVRISLPSTTDEGLNAAQLYEKYFAFDQQNYVQAKGFAATANMFTRRQVMAQVGLFDQRLLSGGDLEFGNRVAAKGYALVYADSAEIVHSARHNLAALMRKARRTAGGKVLLERFGLQRNSLRDWVNILLPPLRTCIRFAADRSLTASGWSRARALAVLNLLHYVALFERISIYLGKTPRR